MSLATFSVPRLLLGMCFYMALLRSTGMGWAYPSDELQLGSIDYTLYTILNFVLLGLVIIYYFISNNYRLIMSIFSHSLVTLVIFACMLSIVFSMAPAQSAKFMLAVVAISLPILTYFHIYGLHRGINRIALFAFIICIINLLYTIALPAYGMMSGKHAGAWRGMFEHKNTAGPFFVIAFYLFFDQLRRRSFRTPFIPIGGMLIAFIFVALSKSSTAIIGFAITGMTYMFLMFIFRLRKRGERFSLFLGMVSCLALFITFGGAMMNELLYDLTGKDASFSGRTAIWAPLYDLSKDEPLHGYGLGMTMRPEFIAKIHGSITMEAKTSHNSYLDIVLNIGYPGAIIFFWLVFKLIGSAFMHPVASRSIVYCYALMVSIAIFLLMVGFTSSGVFIGRTQFWVFLLVSMLGIGMLNKEVAHAANTTRPHTR